MARNLRFGAMLIALIGVGVLLLNGCVNQKAPPDLQLLQLYGQGCASYTAGLKLATLANNTKALSEAQREAISKADTLLFPICTGETPVDLNAAITTITANVATILINAAAEVPK